MRPLSFDECDELLEAITEVLTTPSDDLDVATVRSVLSGLELIVASHAAWARITGAQRPQVRALAARLAELRADVQTIAPVLSRYEVH